MTTPELLAMSLGLSAVVAAVGLAVGRLLDGYVGDAGLREKAWGLAFHLSALPPLLIGAACLLPAPRVMTTVSSPVAATVGDFVLASPAGPSEGWSLGPASVALLVLAGGLAMLCVCRLGWAALRLRRLIGSCVDADPALCGQVEDAAGRIGILPPHVRVSQGGRAVLLAGLVRPTLIIPAVLIDGRSDGMRALIAHELAHLKRGDLRALWAEEVVAAILAVNPLLLLIRAARAAAREEACDAAALAGSDADTRRLYACSLLDAFRTASSPAGVPALAFVSRKRSFAMRRLKSVLTPAAPAGSRTRLILASLGVAVVGAAGAGSLAVAAEREPMRVEAPAPLTAPSVVAAAVAPVVAAPSSAPARPSAKDIVSMPPAAEAVPVEPPAVVSAPTATSEAIAQNDLITNPRWTLRPGPTRYPAEALAAGVDSGSVTLSCVTQADGSLSDCEILYEQPAGQGFGAAVLEGASRGRLSPQSMERLTPGGRVTWTTTMNLPERD